MAIDAANLINSNVVYNTNNSLNTYNKAIQQQQLKAQAEQKSLMEELGSVKADGIREKDIPVYNSKFQKWRDSAIQAEKEADPEKRMMAQSEASRNKNDVANFIVRSKDATKLRAGINTHYVGKDPLEDYTPADWDKYRKSADLSIDDPNYVGDVSQFQIRPDVEGFLKDFSATNDNLLKSKGVFINQKGESVTSGRDSGTIFRNVKVVDPKVQQQEYMLKLTDPKRYKTVQAMYPDLASTLPKDEFIKQASARLTQQYPIKDESSPTIHWISKDPKESEEDSANYEVKNNFSYYSDGEPNKQGSPTKEVRNKTASKSVSFNVPGTITLNPIEKVWDVAGGNLAKFDGKNVNIAAIGWFPTKKGQEKLVTIVDSDGSKYLVPDSDIPISAKSKKQYQKAEATLGERSQPQQVQSKSNSSSSLKGKKYAGLDSNGNPIWK